MTAVKKDDVQVSDTTKKWMKLAPELAKRGVDTSKLKGLNIAVVVGQFEADFDCPILGVDIRAIDNDEMQDWADELLEEHPSWETPAHVRLRHINELLEDSNPPDWSDPAEDEEFLECRYAVRMESRYSVEYVPAADLEAVARIYNEYWFMMTDDNDDYEPYIGGVVDLDTGERAKLNIEEAVITVIDDGESLVEIQRTTSGETRVNHDLVTNWKSES